MCQIERLNFRFCEIPCLRFSFINKKNLIISYLHLYISNFKQQESSVAEKLQNVEFYKRLLVV